MAKVTNDFKVSEWTTTYGEPRWRVMVGGTDVVSVCRSLEQAQTLAKNLNKDPWFLDKGNTRADRIAAHNQYNYSKGQ